MRSAGPGRAAWGLCRDDNGESIGDLDRLGVGNGVCWPQGGQCGDSAGVTGNQ